MDTQRMRRVTLRLSFENLQTYGPHGILTHRKVLSNRAEGAIFGQNIQKGSLEFMQKREVSL